MNAYFSFTLKSRNSKTGDIPVSTSNKATCPNACPLKTTGACYAKHGPLGMLWSAIDSGNAKRGAITWSTLLSRVSALPEGQLWRHNQAGDLPGEGDTVDPVALMELVQANSGKRGFTYTHKPVEKNHVNAGYIKGANDLGFTVNLSADNLNEADDLKALSIGPVVTVLPREAPAVSYTPKGHKVVVCPAQQRDNVTCKSCGLCAIATRDVIVGFLAHGVSAKRAEAIALS